MATNLARKCVLYVRHGPEDEAKMIGKVIMHHSRGLVFFHAQSGTQYHRNHQCPAPIDVTVATQLALSGVKDYYSYDRAGKILWRIGLEEASHAPIELYGDRARFYPRETLWTKIEEVLEVDKRGFKEYQRRNFPILRVPFYRGEKSKVVIEDPSF